MNGHAILLGLFAEPNGLNYTKSDHDLTVFKHTVGTKHVPVSIEIQTLLAYI